ncbi:MAG: hypothetical protein M0008_05105 [Actinomycetota bacterium]|jgi:hypothetical protein|nr:hypothetical protein [Actinomycetota bacterium]
MLHESVVFSYSVRNRTCFVMLRLEEIEPARAATQRCRASKAALEEQDEAGLAALIAAHRQDPPACFPRRTRCAVAR